MNTNSSSTRRFIDYGLPSFVLVILLIYTYAKFFEHPYTGFRLDSAGNVFLIFVEQQTEPELQVGDQVIEINSVKWEDYQEDLRLKIFKNATPGKVIELLVKRENQNISIPWIVAGPNLGEIRDLLIGRKASQGSNRRPTDTIFTITSKFHQRFDGAGVTAVA